MREVKSQHSNKKMKHLTDPQLYRLFQSTEDWKVSLDAQAVIDGILARAKADPQLAAELDQIDRELAAAQEGWVTSLLEAAPEDSLGFQDCL